MRDIVKKNKELRINYAAYEPKKIMLKMFTTFFFMENYSCFIPKFCVLLKTNGYVSLFKNYCMISTQQRSVFSRLKLSRWTAKEFASYGELSGFKRKSW
jgi:ribosomal protein S14